MKNGFTLSEDATHRDPAFQLSIEKKGGMPKEIGSPAFTLAEVLITLGIIGVVAALTMPALITNHQKNVTVTRLKHTYAVVNQAVKRSEIDNGPLEEWNTCEVDSFNIDSYNCGKIFAEKYLIPYMNVIKTCEHSSTDCIAKKSYRNDGSLNSYFSASSNHTYNFMLSNGVMLGIWPRTYMIEVYVDLNGKAKPNIYGRDQFNIILARKMFTNQYGKISRAGVWFYGQGYDREYLLNKTAYSCKAYSSVGGSYCAALIMYDGWRIAPDYPW